jgi:Zn-dependent protease
VTGPGTYLAVVIYTLPGFVVGSVIHELSHAAVSLRSGDPTPRRDRRMTLDPRRNIDAFGAAAMLIAGFGWGKPVALDPLYLRDPRRRAAVAAVGPLAHLVVAAIFALALRVELTGAAIDPRGFDVLAQFTLEGVLFGVLLQGFLVNIALFVFNALPLPGLDGYAVVRSLLFGRFPRFFLFVEHYRYAVYAVVALAALVPLQVTNGAVNPIASMTIGAASLTFEHLIEPGVTPIFIGLPNVFTLFS